MPQIDQFGESWYFASQLFWLVLVFGAIFLVIGLGMLPKIENSVDLRDRKIADDLAAAKAARDRADQIEEEYRAKSNAARADAQAVITASKSAAAKDAEQRLSVVNAELDAKLASAEMDIGTAKRSALAEVEHVASDVTKDIVSRLSGVSVSGDDVTQAVKAAVNG